VVIKLTAISIHLPSDGHFQTDTPATSKCIVTLTTASRIYGAVQEGFLLVSYFLKIHVLLWFDSSYLRTYIHTQVIL